MAVLYHQYFCFLMIKSFLGGGWGGGNWVFLHHIYFSNLILFQEENTQDLPPGHLELLGHMLCW